MINGYIGFFPFSFLDGNLQWEQSEYREVTKIWERGRAFSRTSSRTKICTLVGEVDLLYAGARQQQMLSYISVKHIPVRIQIREAYALVPYPGFWKILDIRDVTEQTVVAIGAGGLQGGNFILRTEWDVARIDL